MGPPGWRMCLCQKLLFAFITILVLRAFSFLGRGMSGKTGWAESLENCTQLHRSTDNAQDRLQGPSSTSVSPQLPLGLFLLYFLLSSSSTSCPPPVLPVLFIYFLLFSFTSCLLPILPVLLIYSCPPLFLSALLLILDFLFYFPPSSFNSHPTTSCLLLLPPLLPTLFAVNLISCHPSLQ